MRFSSGSLDVLESAEIKKAWQERQLAAKKNPWVVLEKELETSLLNSTTALMDQHQLNHQFCGQSQHTQHIQQKKSKKRSLFRTASIHKHHKKNHTLRHIFLQEKKCLFRPHFSQYKCTEVFQKETFFKIFNHCKYYYVLEHEEEQLMMEFSEFSAKVSNSLMHLASGKENGGGGR